MNNYFRQRIGFFRTCLHLYIVFAGIVLAGGLDDTVSKCAGQDAQFVEDYSRAFSRLQEQFSNYIAKGTFETELEKADFVLYKRGSLQRLDLAYTAPLEEAGEVYYRVVNRNRSFGVRSSPKNNSGRYYVDDLNVAAELKLEHIQSNFPATNVPWQFLESSLLEIMKRPDLSLEVKTENDEQLVVNLSGLNESSGVVSSPYYQLVLDPSLDLAISSYRFSGKPLSQNSGIERVVSYGLNSDGSFAPKSVTEYRLDDGRQTKTLQVVFTSFDFAIPSESRFELSDFGFDNRSTGWWRIVVVAVCCLVGLLFTYRAFTLADRNRN